MYTRATTPGVGPVLCRFTRGLRGDVMLAVAAALLQAGLTALAGRHQTDARSLDLLGFLLLVAGPAALVVRRRWPVAVLAVAFATTLGYVLLDYPGGPIWFGLIISFGTALVTGHRLVAYGSLALGYVSFLWLATLATDRPAPSVWERIGIAAWMLFLPAVIELARNRRAYAQVRRERAIEELRSQHEAARRQASEERLGIARELHDVLAHSLSLINVQAGVALELMDGRPEQARSALTTIKQASKEALVEVQSVLGSLRRPGEEPPHAPTPTLKDVDELVRRAESAGLTVALQVSGQSASLPSGVGSAAYRIVQESLTNVVRHADAATVMVQICCGEAELLLLVDDDGHGRPTSSTSGSGSGIIGMRERAVALGGELEAGPKAGGGFRVRARIPLPDGSRDETRRGPQ